MQMDSTKEEYHRDCVMENASDPGSLCSGAPGISQIWGDRQVLPRVGNEYQVNVPPLITKADILQLDHDSCRIGLTLPIMWVHNELDGSKIDHNGSSEFKRNRKIRSCSKKEASKLKKNSSNSISDCVNQVKQESKNKVHFPVPGCLGSSWTEFEKECFLLGLYIFGKNLVRVKKFVESKEMSDILSFYYGEFYRSIGQRRWSECMKMKKKRCIHGHKIFTGSRQHEFLSRLLPLVPEECRNILLEVSKSFVEGKISLEEYVSILKAKAGLDILIEIVGIGKGKQDLTGTITEPTRTNQVVSSRPRLPIGKVCSDLTSEDIIRFLNGDFRLSKTISNDLFWEAVWPRLLARGWHSEQPNNRIRTNLNSLVFIIPGIKKFSRRKLIKGDHYFDSVTDVLDKVSADPQLLELETDPAKDNMRNEENGSAQKKMKLDSNYDYNRQCRSYLKTKLSKSISDLMIAETNLSNREDAIHIEESKRLPMDTANISAPTTSSSENKEILSYGLLSSQGDTMFSVPTKEILSNGPDKANVTLEGPVGSNAGNDNNPSKVIKCQFSRRKKPSQSNYLTPVTKRHRLTARCQSDTRCKVGSLSVDSGFRKDDERLMVGRCSPSEPVGSEVRLSSDKKVSISSSAKDSGSDCSSEGNLSENCIVKPTSHEKHRRKELIDLNLPHVPLNLETGEPFTTEVGESLKTRPLPCSDNTSEQKQPVVIARRQSTRNRPLTKRALEAFAYGYLNTKRKTKVFVAGL